MTKYTVVWAEAVEIPFIDSWVKGDSQVRAVLSDIANWVDSNLSRDPELKGRQALDPGTRVVVVPLVSSAARVSVTYEIIPADRLVRVIRMTFRG
jgi:hypothetical protein